MYELFVRGENGEVISHFTTPDMKSAIELAEANGKHGAVFITAEGWNGSVIFTKAGGHRFTELEHFEEGAPTDALLLEAGLKIGAVPEI